MKLTAKEYAKGLVEKYFSTCHKSSDLELSWKVCKQCAKIAADELLLEWSELKNADCSIALCAYNIQYWQQVKIEIDLL